MDCRPTRYPFSTRKLRGRKGSYYSLFKINYWLRMHQAKKRKGVGSGLLPPADSFLIRPVRVRSQVVLTSFFSQMDLMLLSRHWHKGMWSYPYLVCLRCACFSSWPLPFGSFLDPQCPQIIILRFRKCSFARYSSKLFLTTLWGQETEAQSSKVTFLH